MRTASFIAIIIISAISSCQKNKPKKGDYIGNFYADTSAGWPILNHEWDILNTSIKISDVTETTFVINENYYAPLEKSGDSVKGFVGCNGGYGGGLGHYAPYIYGTWHNTLSRKKIDGTFKGLTDIGWYYSGTFEIIRE